MDCVKVANSEEDNNFMQIKAQLTAPFSFLCPLQHERAHLKLCIMSLHLPGKNIKRPCQMYARQEGSLFCCHTGTGISSQPACAIYRFQTILYTMRLVNVTKRMKNQIFCCARFHLNI